MEVRYRLAPAQKKVLTAISRCRTAALGGHKLVCERGDFEQISCNSCRDQHCPKCQALAQVEAWLLLEPACTTVALMARLQKEYPDLISNKQIRTLQRRVKEWRSEYARQLVFGRGAVEQEQCG